MDEARKLWDILSSEEKDWFVGSGIDIGCGTDPIKSDVKRFDVQDGDANVITRHVQQTFDFVFSSHCLEHMHNPEAALSEWWHLVKPGGHLIFIVPDEDLYEQGVFPSRFNSDHKATFTISKRKSWSEHSYNVLDLALGLPSATLLKLELQDLGYIRQRYNHGLTGWHWELFRILRIADAIGFKWSGLELIRDRSITYDQTAKCGVMAQIFCAVIKS